MFINIVLGEKLLRELTFFKVPGYATLAGSNVLSRQLVFLLTIEWLQ